MSAIPIGLITSFRAAERKEDIAVLMHADDGFDAETMRVLAAWVHTENRWETPTADPPPFGPTPAAWKWLVRGWEVDYQAIADGADVSRSVVRAKMDLLVGNRMCYPDGSMHAFARKAISTFVAHRLKLKAKRAPEPAPDPTPEGEN